MTHVFLATLGQRPEAITLALDRLLDRYAIQAVVILHTEPTYSGIAESLRQLMPVLNTDYPGLTVRGWELRDGEAPILDIDSRHSADAYFQAVYAALAAYHGRPRHLLVSGGRKAMSIYAMLAATLLFGVEDRAWTVLSPAALVQQPGLFHSPPGWHDQVQLAPLPVVPSHLARVEGRADGLTHLRRRQDVRRDFLERLHPQERHLVELLSEQPYATNEDLARWLRKSPRTVENQLRSVYARLDGFLDEPAGPHKRQALIDLLMIQG